MPPKVSICIPASHKLQYFKQALDSALTQTFSDYEIIVSDDSSSDAISEYVQSHRIPKLKYTRNSSPLGITKNWNACLKCAEGKFIKYLHDDDYFSNPTSLETFVHAIESSPKVGFVWCASQHVDAYDMPLHCFELSASQQSEMKEDPLAFHFQENYVGSPSITLFRKETIEDEML